MSKEPERRSVGSPLSGLNDLSLGGASIDHIPTTEELLIVYEADPNAVFAFDAPSTPYIGRSVVPVEVILRLRQAI
jgi:hypothetical protein